MRDGLWARTLFASKTTRLSDEEKRMLYDPAVLDWDGLNADLLLEVAINRATSLERARGRELVRARGRELELVRARTCPELVRAPSSARTRPSSNAP